jgi:hypothetical protein
MGLETCENCERIIGKLEQAYVYNNKVICKECNALLCIKTNNEPANNSKRTVYVKPSKKIQTITIEKTGKRWKAYKLVGVVLILIAIPMMCAGHIGAGVLIGIVGITLYITSRAGAWWYHG